MSQPKETEAINATRSSVGMNLKFMTCTGVHTNQYFVRVSCASSRYFRRPNRHFSMGVPGKSDFINDWLA